MVLGCSIDRYSFCLSIFHYLIHTQVRIAKIGQWGGIGGNYRDIEVAPCRLKSLIIGSGGAIYSIGFSYYDDNGKQHKVGPWGGHGANKGIDHTVSVNVSLTY